MKRILLTIVSATAVLALSGCGKKSEPAVVIADNIADANAVTPAVVQISPGQKFANDAAASDAFEIAASSLALQKSKSSSVQSFAKKMIAAHVESTTKLKAAASSASPALVPDPSLSSAQQAKISLLQEKTGAEFDAAYTEAQVAAHQAALNALRAYGSTGDVPQLKAFAQAITPIVAAHVNMATALKP